MKRHRHPATPPRAPITSLVFAVALASFVLAGLLSPARGQTAGPNPATGLPPTELPGLRHTNAFFPGITYRAAIPDPSTLLGFPVGERAATTEEIARCLRAWTQAAPDRARLVEYARSHEGRPLHYLVLGSPARMARLDAIAGDLARFADPRQTSEAEAARLAEQLPGVAWLAYTIHGDETEGSDAALAVIHHLLAAEDPAVDRILDRLLVIVDPVMNPDGRDRFLKMIAEHRGTTPSVDEQSLLHSGYWPYGRGNHYLFDLNRDWIFARHPETRGRIREVSRWLPILFVDAHGMGAQDTHLFSPPREPINPHLPGHRRLWSEVFARDQAAAFDRHGLVYYTGEWNEEWYPGYSDGWAAYRGAVGILYEQARIAADGVRRPEGRILSYRESVFHHVVGSFANLTTAAANSRDLLTGLHTVRRTALAPDGPFARRTFAIPPPANTSRFRELAALLQLQGFEVHTNSAPLEVPTATDQLGATVERLSLPPGTLLVPNRQPLGHLVAALLDFDTRMPERAIEEERRELLRTGGSRIYDVSAWNLTMMFGLPAFILPTDLPNPTGPLATAISTSQPPAAVEKNAVAWVFDGADDLSLPAAARLLERGVQARTSTRPFSLDGRSFGRGSIVVTRLDNRTFTGDLAAALETTGRELGFPPVPVFTGLGPGDLPDLGGGHFPRLEPPRIATLGRDATSMADYGSIWFTLDHELGIRHAQLDGGRGADLARYNVLIIPERWGDNAGALTGALKDWVSNGGTLIAIGQGATPWIAEKAEFSRVRALPDVLGRLPEYELAVLREWHGRTGPIPASTQLWAHLPPTRIEYPWQIAGSGHPDEKELRRRDAWQSIFMPEGAFFATRLDTNHWLTAGCPEPLPVLAGRGPVLMAADGIEAPIRYGLLTPAPVTEPPADAQPGGSKNPEARDASREPARIGWSALPPSTRMHLRMSGLVWPEATHRLANAAWVTRESLGRGQVILFASGPTFRSATRGMTRVFLNAAVLGPGLGASTPLRP